MVKTRLETRGLVEKVAMGTELARQAAALLDEALVELTDEEREETLRAPLGLVLAGPALARAATEFPDLAKRADFDAAAVEEDLANAQALAPLAERLEALLRRVQDSRLVWLAEAYEPSLALYRLAKACARVDGRLEPLVTPMEEVFANRRTRKAKAEDEPRR